MVSGFFSLIDSQSITEIPWRGLGYRVEWVEGSLSSIDTLYIEN